MSILDQTFSDFRLIISDNASTDSTEEICRDFASADSRITYIRQMENRGASFNFNYVFELADSPYFRWANHDDLCAPNHFEVCLSAIEAAPPEVVLVYTGTMLIDAEGSPIEPYEDGLELSQRRPNQRLAQLIGTIRLQNLMYGVLRSEMLDSTRLLDRFASSDEVLLAEMAMLGEFKFIPETLFFRRVHDESSVKANPDPESRTAWFDPSINRKRFFPRWRVYGETARSATRLPLSPIEKVRCVRTLTSTYSRRHWRLMAKEIIGGISGQH